MNVDPMSTNLTAVHDLVTEALAVAEDNDTPCNYGIAIFPRAGRFEAPVFGVLTRGGESTTLTYRMLRTLMDHQVLISGRVLATLHDTMAFSPSRVPPPALLDQPALHVSFKSFIPVGQGQLDQTMALESTVFASELEAPIVLVMENRPQGWPK
jgi:hypothetical protein